MRSLILVLLCLAYNAGAVTLSPMTPEDVSLRGIPIQLPDSAPSATSWEMDVPLLSADGNILHLLGSAQSHPLSNPKFLEVVADLVGITQSDCTAHVAALIDTTTQKCLAEKFQMSCLGKTIHTAVEVAP